MVLKDQSNCRAFPEHDFGYLDEVPPKNVIPMQSHTLLLELSGQCLSSHQKDSSISLGESTSIFKIITPEF